MINLLLFLYIYNAGMLKSAFVYFYPIKRLASQERRQVRLEKRWSQHQTELHNIQKTKMRRNHSTWLTAKTVSKCFFFLPFYPNIKIKIFICSPYTFSVELVGRSYQNFNQIHRPINFQYHSVYQSGDITRRNLILISLGA